MNASILVLIGIAIGVPWLARAEYSVPIVSDNDLASIASSLAIFADSLDALTLSNKTALSEAIVAYLESHGPEYFGSTVTVLNKNGTAAYSPYVYHDDADNLIQTDDLMAPSYSINEQAWLREPIDQGKAIWTDPYFDEGGGSIWMRTRSYPIFNSTSASENDDIVAVATTDIRVEAPQTTSSGTTAIIIIIMLGVVLLLWL
jgi:sigma-B regulation protein RsbU (phosphoserine phosphatase)